MSTIATNSQGPNARQSWTRYFTVILGICLTLVALFTAWLEHPIGLPATPLTLSAGFLIVVVSAELGVAWLLLGQSDNRLGWIASCIFFLLFGVAFLLQATTEYYAYGRGPNLIEQFACGLLYVLVAVVMGVGVRRVREYGQTDPPANLARQRRLLAVTFIALLAICASKIALGSRSFAAFETAALGNDRLVILHPVNWIGGPLPISEHVLPEINFATGDWTILLYQHECPKSQSMLPRYAELAAQNGEGGNVAVIEFPPYATELWSFAAVQHATISNEREWIVQTPVEIQIRNGIVVGASLDMPSITASSPE